MALTIIIDAMDRMTIEQHAQESVRRMMRYADPFAPRLPEKADVYMRHYCEEGHQYWSPMDRQSELCPEHMADEVVRAKYGYGHPPATTIFLKSEDGELVPLETV